MPTFCPPIDLIGPRTVPDPDPGNAVFRYYKPLPVGRNIYKLADGTFTDIAPYPNIDASTRALGDPEVTVAFTYYGGHEYEVTDAEWAALSAAGFPSSCGEAPAPPPPPVVTPTPLYPALDLFPDLTVFPQG